MGEQACCKGTSGDGLTVPRGVVARRDAERERERESVSETSRGG